MKPLLIFLSALLCAPMVGAAPSVHVSLPQKGSYRPGQFMQVALTVDDAAARNDVVTISAPGALPTHVKLGGRSSAAVPLLMLSPNAGPLSVAIGASEPKVIDLPLLATSDDDDSIGPRGALGPVEAYAPVFTWHPGASTRVRRLIILTAVLVSALLLASSLLPTRARWVVGSTLSVVLLAAIGIEILRRNVSPIWRAGGEVIVRSHDGVQIDNWQYFAARSRAKVTVELTNMSWPLFMDESQAREVEAALEYEASRSTLFLTCVLNPQQSLAVYSRRFQSTGNSPSMKPSQPLRSPLIPLAQRLYESRDLKIIGEGAVQWIDDQTIHWPSVVLTNDAGR